jgi:hypothetical protein
MPSLERSMVGRGAEAAAARVGWPNQTDPLVALLTVGDHGGWQLFGDLQRSESVYCNALDRSVARPRIGDLQGRTLASPLSPS